jgi:cytochrome c-type biogenesis protein CcmH
MRSKWFAACGLWLALFGTALALPIDTPLPDTKQEARAKALFHEIRCVVCQGETIADSPADIAGDMRRLIRERIATGESNRDIVSYLVEHYGDSILMNPPLNRATSFLWFGPWVILSGAGLLAARYFRNTSPKQSS